MAFEASRKKKELSLRTAACLEVTKQKRDERLGSGIWDSCCPLPWESQGFWASYAPGPHRAPSAHPEPEQGIYTKQRGR
jgi:hypothetical protein